MTGPIDFLKVFRVAMFRGSIQYLFYKKGSAYSGHTFSKQFEDGCMHSFEFRLEFRQICSPVSFCFFFVLA